MKKTIIFLFTLICLTSCEFKINNPFNSTSNKNDRFAPNVFNNRQTIVDQTFHIGARQYTFFEFGLNQDATITGKFSAQGGSNDIECVIFDEDGFVNFKNGHRAAKVFYNSRGYVTQGTINKNLPPGNYFIIFNNVDSIFTNKTVTAKIEIE